MAPRALRAQFLLRISELRPQAGGLGRIVLPAGVELRAHGCGVFRMLAFRCSELAGKKLGKGAASVQQLVEARVSYERRRVLDGGSANKVVQRVAVGNKVRGEVQR